jgi:hypothetical protein
MDGPELTRHLGDRPEESGDSLIGANVGVHNKLLSSIAADKIGDS